MSFVRPGLRPIENLRALTGARFVAALAVLLCHFGLLANWPLWVAAHGREAVAFFFVLSGFVLMYNYADRLPDGDRGAYGRFLQARFARIYPIHLLIMVLATFVLLWIGDHDPAQRPPGSSLELACGWVMNLLLVQSYSTNATTCGHWTGPAWSVSCEATFYVAFPVLLWQLRRLSSPRTIAFLAAGVWGATVTLVAVACLAAKLVLHKHTEGLEYLAYHAPYLRLGEFVVGCLAGLWFVRRGPTPLPGRAIRELAVWGSLAVTTTLAVLTNCNVIPLLYGMSVIFTPAFAVFVVALASGPTSLGTALSWRPLERLGEASYSLYLVHWLPLVVMARVFSNVSTHAAVLAIVGSVLASLGLFYAIEDPCRSLLRRRPTAGTVTRPMLGTMATN